MPRARRKPFDPSKPIAHDRRDSVQRTTVGTWGSSVIRFPSEPHHPGLDIRVVERRIHRACRTIRALPDAEAKFFNIHSCWPDIQQAVEEAYGYTEATLPRFRPTPFDVSDVLNALSWANTLEKREFRLIWWRAFDYSFGWIGRRIGRSDETARRHYKDAMLRVWGEANTQHLASGA